jgi:hypothetical protein
LLKRIIHLDFEFKTLFKGNNMGFMDEFQKIGRGLRGWKKGELVVISGKIGAGKSSMNIDDLFGDYCSVCTTELLEVVDEDPNGEMKSKCARCEKMEEIDFDLYPDATVTRDGLVDYGDGEE